jgi:hypothetical protein
MEAFTSNIAMQDDILFPHGMVAMSREGLPFRTVAFCILPALSYTFPLTRTAHGLVGEATTKRTRHRLQGAPCPVLPAVTSWKCSLFSSRAISGSSSPQLPRALNAQAVSVPMQARFASWQSPFSTHQSAWLSRRHRAC